MLTLPILLSFEVTTLLFNIQIIYLGTCFLIFQNIAWQKWATVEHHKHPLKIAVLGILGRLFRRRLIHSAKFCCHFLFESCLINNASYLRIFKRDFSGLSAGPFNIMFDVMEKWRKMYLPLMVCDLDKLFILLKFWVCVI